VELLRREYWSTFLKNVEKQKTLNFPLVCKNFGLKWNQVRYTLMNDPDANAALKDTISILKFEIYDSMTNGVLNDEKSMTNSALAKEMIRILSSGEMFKPDYLPLDSEREEEKPVDPSKKMTNDDDTERFGL